MPDKKSHKLVFEYDCMCWFGNSYNLKLYEDCRLNGEEREEEED